MKRKRVVIVTGNQRVAQAIFSDVKAVFNNDVDIDIVYPSQIASLDAVEADAFLVTRWYNIGGLTDKVSSKSKVVRTTRTISESGYKKITKIPPGTNVLVVNDSEQSTSGVIELLMDLHIDGLTYVPYTAGHYDPSLKIAITPGESRYVPSYIENIIDIGNRHIDISTVLALCNVMEVNTSEIAGPLMNYFNMLLCRDVISRQYRDTLSKSMYMNSILKHMEQGVLLTAPDGRIILSNGKMNELLRMQITENRDYVSAVFPEGTAARIANMDNDTLALNVNGREMLINHETLNFGDTINHNLYFFNDVTYIRRLERKSREESLQKGFVAKHSFDDIVHVSAVMDECIRRARLFSRSDKTVLIQGESGTGKELVAQSIHNASSRRNKPFVAVNCAALPESLLESELFGYERGAFTGARQSGKKGLFEQANGGTIFLDEIGDMPLALQSRLLRVLQEKQVMRVGADYYDGTTTDFSTVGIKALDDYTVEYTLVAPLPYFIKMVSLNPWFPAQADFLAEQGDQFGTSNDTLLYCGAYLFDTFEPEYQRVLVMNENYWHSDIISIKKLVWKYNKEASANGPELYLRGETDKVTLGTDIIEEWKADPELWDQVHPAQLIAHDLSIMLFITNRLAVIHKGRIVELSETEKLFAHPLHPYTKSLLSAIPQPDPLSEKGKKTLPYDPSCHDYSVDKPEWLELEDGHFVLANNKEAEQYRKELAN